MEWELLLQSPLPVPGSGWGGCSGTRAKPILESVLELVVPRERQSSSPCALTTVAAGQAWPQRWSSHPAPNHNL